MESREIWRDIIGYEDIYQVSNLGRVKSLGNNKNKKEKILKPRYNNKGYAQVHLCKNNKSKNYQISILVAKAFIPNPENKPTVDHIDRNPKNNNVENLRWATMYEQIHNRSLHKKVRCIDTNIVYDSSTEASRQTGIAQSSIVACCKRRYKTAGGFRWAYL